jgi:UDP-glucuronate decarboxylase
MSVDDGRVISNFAVQALLGHDITVFGDGSQTRSFCYVDDTVTGLVRLMKHQSDLGPVNLGNPAEHTILELAEHVVRLTGGRSRIVRRDLPLDDPRRRRPDISLARKCLGFEPTVGLCEGLVRTVESFRLSLSCERGQGAATLSD